MTTSSRRKRHKRPAPSDRRTWLVLVCMQCGFPAVVDGRCGACGSDRQDEPFREGWDESD